MGGVTDWIITTSGTWVVPKTGRYYLELYGGGGGVDYYGSLSAGVSAQGGSSCQSYDSIYLTVGDSISVIIGTCGYARYDMTSTATATSFGTYSVEGGGNGNGKTSSGGTGAGNLGINGHTVSYNSASYVYNNGVLGTLYGVGGYGGRNSTTS